MGAISIYSVIKTVIKKKGLYWTYLEMDTYGEDVLTFSEFSNIDQGTLRDPDRNEAGQKDEQECDHHPSG